MSIQQHNPPHPGWFIKQVYLEPFDIGSNAAAARLLVSPSTFNRLINEKSDITPEMALKLSKVFGRSPESWLAMQNSYDLWKAKAYIDLDIYEQFQYAV